MNAIPNTSFDFSAAIQGVPYERKWEIFKPELQVLFHSQNNYEALAQYMRAKYGFDAYVPAYKYHFKKWGWKKSIPAHKKIEVLNHAQQRTLQGKRTASATFGTTVINPKKLKRYVTNTQRSALTMLSFGRESDLQMNSFGVYLPSGIRPFATWNMPFGGASKPFALSATSPSETGISKRTPSDVEFQTPSDYQTPSAASPADHPSPLSAAVRVHASNNRARLFSQGKVGELVETMDRNAQRTMSTWLYQFWLFAFKTAKSWGPNFQAWDVTRLEFDNYQVTKLVEGSTPRGANDSSPRNHHILDDDFTTALGPSDLCQWSIHLYDQAMYGEVDNLPVDDRGDELRDWPRESMGQFLNDGIRDNNFSTVLAEEIPMNLSLIADGTANSPQVLLGEVLSFAIMAQNSEALERILNERSFDERVKALKDIYAMHIATSYLNGGKLCCNVLASICSHLNRINISDIYTNEQGYTVLDNLMLNILQSHSTTGIEIVDDSLKPGTRYAGIEVDICGRWDADSPCFRALVATGTRSIPHHWKHKFCNTSVQAICHCIHVMTHWFGISRFNTSGLFQKLCIHCGTKLQLKPLHSLLMVGYALASNACAGEDLFGILACFLCLLHHGFDPLEKAQISTSALLGQNEDSDDCTHESMTPHGLLQRLSEDVDDSWSEEIRTGWRILSKSLKRGENGHIDMRQWLNHFYHYEDEDEDEDEEEEDEDEDKDDAWSVYHSVQQQFKAPCDEWACVDYDNPQPLAFGTDPTLGYIWAGVQAEFLNYRRIVTDNSWLSEHFNMATLAHSLEHDDTTKTGYSHKNMLRDHCACARFGIDFPPLREDVSRDGSFFSNMDCWERSSFIDCPFYRND